MLALPLRVEHTVTQQEFLESAFQDMIDSSDFIERKDEQTFNIPLFGPQADVTFRVATTLADGRQKAILSAPNLSPTDFGWICAKLYESKEKLEPVLDLTLLRAAVAGHYNNQPPHPGHPASSAQMAGNQCIGRLFDDANILESLQKEAFIVVDDEDLPKTTEKSHEKMSKYLVEKTGQGEDTRTDTVHFLNRDQAKHCGIQRVSLNQSSLSEFHSLPLLKCLSCTSKYIF